MNQSIDLGHLDRLARPEGPYAFQREGKIRELHNLTDLEENTLENEILNAVTKANPRELAQFNNMSMSRQGLRYYTGKGPDFDTI